MARDQEMVKLLQRRFPQWDPDGICDFWYRNKRRPTVEAPVLICLDDLVLVCSAKWLLETLDSHFSCEIDEISYKK